MPPHAGRGAHHPDTALRVTGLAGLLVLVFLVAATAGCGAAHRPPTDTERRSAAARLAQCRQRCSPMRVTDEVVWRRGCGPPCIESGGTDDRTRCGPLPDGCTPRREYVFAFDCPNWRPPSRPGAGDVRASTTYSFDEAPFPLLCVDDIETGGVRCFEGLSTDGIEARCP